jgi:hypothetical protein
MILEYIEAGKYMSADYSAGCAGDGSEWLKKVKLYKPVQALVQV